MCETAIFDLYNANPNHVHGINLVIVPAIVTKQWEREIKKFAPNMVVYTVSIESGSFQPNLIARDNKGNLNNIIVVCSFSMIKKITESIYLQEAVPNSVNKEKR